MDGYLPFSVPLLGEEEIAEVVDTLRSGWITTGPKTRRFEKEFASFVGCPHAVAVNSCTAALHVALEALGIGEGDEVLTTPMTFAATAEVIRYVNARPVFVDIDPRTMNMDPGRLREEVEKRVEKGGSPRAVIAVHYAGAPCDMEPIVQTAREHGLRVVEDAAHALPASYRGRNVGTLGDIACFSFYATKNITTGEGGMATTGNPEWAERMRVMSLHGISKDAWKRYSADGDWYYEIMAPGFKYNLTDIAAALGRVQLRRAGEFLARRRQIAAEYNRAFEALDGVEPPADEDGPGRHAWHLYVLRLELEGLSIDRDRFIQELRSRGIGTSVHFIPLHIHPYYRDTYGYRPEDFPVAFGQYKRIVSLPIYPRMTDGDVQRVIEAVSDVAARYRTRKGLVADGGKASRPGQDG